MIENYVIHILLILWRFIKIYKSVNIKSSNSLIKLGDFFRTIIRKNEFIDKLADLYSVIKECCKTK